MAVMTVIEAVRSTLDEALAEDDRVFILGEDVEAGGVFRATEGLKARYGERIIDSPLSESSIIGVSIGAAHYGLRPIAEIQFADFIHAGFDQLCSEASRWSYRTRGDAWLPMVVRTPWGGGVHGGQHHSQSIEAFYSHMPGIKVVAPAFPADYRSLLKAAIADPNPVLFLEHKMLYFTRGDVPEAEEEYTVPIGKADIKREGKDLTLVTFSYCLLQALEAAEELKAEHGLDIEVVDLRSIVPLDMETVLASVAKTGRLLAVHESQSNCGIGAEVVARAYEEAPYLLKAPARRLGMAPVSIPVSKPLEEEILPWKKNMKAAVLEMLR